LLETDDKDELVGATDVVVTTVAGSTVLAMGMEVLIGTDAEMSVATGTEAESVGISVGMSVGPSVIGTSVAPPAASVAVPVPTSVVSVCAKKRKGKKNCEHDICVFMQGLPVFI
jgi:chorismate synthase